MKIYGPWWSQGFNPGLDFGFIILRKGRLRDKSGMLRSCHRLFSIPKSTLFITCKRFKIFIDLPKNICTLPDTSSHIHIWMASFCSSDHSSIQSKLNWESQTVHGVMSGQLRIKQPFDSNFHIKHVNRSSIPSVILNLGSKAQKRPGRARLCHNSKESWDTHRADTETPQCSLAKGWPPGSLPEAQEQAHSHSGFPEASTAAQTRSAVFGDHPHSGHHNLLCTPQLGQAPETGPSSDKATCCGYPSLSWKKYFPLAIHSGPRLAHYPVSCTHKPSNKVGDGSTSSPISLHP